MGSKKQSIYTVRTYQSKANTERALQKIKHADNWSEMNQAHYLDMAIERVRFIH